jgi:glycosyltransferase involved in cell wall biosynthesis
MVEPNTSKRPDVSIVIPCYNGMTTIERCLRSVREALDGQNAEVIMVDSSDDGTDRYVQKHFPEVRLKHLDEKALPGKARNQGVEMARSNLIAFLDADCMVYKAHITNSLASFERYPDQVAIVGCVENGNPGLASWVSFISEFNGFFGKQVRQRMYSLPTYCAVYKRDVFERYKGFPEDLWPGEDAILSARLAENNEQIFLEPALRVHHNNRETMDAYLHHQYKIGVGFTVSRRLLPQLPGADKLARSGLYVWPMAGYRGVMMLKRSFAAGWAYGFRAVLFLPWYLCGCWQWMRGVWHGRKQS